MPFAVLFNPEPPLFRRFDSVALIPYPERRAWAADIPRTIPIIGCGPSASIADAYHAGCADYLCDPWDEAELAARTGRLLYRTALHLGTDNAVLKGTRLDGPKGSIPLSFEEATLLRVLFRQAGTSISRVALRRTIWPALPECSRIVDETVSRLRGRLQEAGISKSSIYIRSIRGFGYQLETDSSMCITCG